MDTSPVHVVGRAAFPPAARIPGHSLCHRLIAASRWAAVVAVGVCGIAAAPPEARACSCSPYPGYVLPLEGEMFPANGHLLAMATPSATRLLDADGQVIPFVEVHSTPAGACSQPFVGLEPTTPLVPGTAYELEVPYAGGRVRFVAAEPSAGTAKVDLELTLVRHAPVPVNTHPCAVPLESDVSASIVVRSDDPGGVVVAAELGYRFVVRRVLPTDPVTEHGCHVCVPFLRTENDGTCVDVVVYDSGGRAAGREHRCFTLPPLDGEPGPEAGSDDPAPAPSLDGSLPDLDACATGSEPTPDDRSRCSDTAPDSQPDAFPSVPVDEPSRLVAAPSRTSSPACSIGSPDTRDSFALAGLVGLGTAFARRRWRPRSAQDFAGARTLHPSNGSLRPDRELGRASRVRRLRARGRESRSGPVPRPT